MASDMLRLLGRLPGCGRLDQVALAALAGAARVEDHPEGACLVAEGSPTPDWYCVVERGGIRVSRTADGIEETLDELATGDVLDPGTPGLPAACSAVVSEPVRCLLIPQSVVARHRGSLAAGPAASYRSEAALFVRRVVELVKGPLVCSPPGASVGEAARLMTSRAVGSVAVVGADGAPVGIVTDRDLRAKVLARGLSPATPVSDVMSAPLVSIAPDRSAFDALLEMTRRGIHHLGVVADDRLVGVLSSHDIILLQAAHPVAVMRDIGQQASIDDLALVAPRAEAVVRWLVDQGVSPYDIGRIVAEINDRLVSRALALVVEAAEAESVAPFPRACTWIAAGSEGRREQTLRTDQDNAIVYQDPPLELAATAADHYRRLGRTMGEALERLGFPRCEGGFTAANPLWCQPESTWRSYFGSWMESPRGEQVLRASLFFDLRPVAGDVGPGHRLWEWVCDRASSQRLFLSHMAKDALGRHVPIGFFGRFVVERSGAHRDTFDIKARGVLPITQAMRVHALSLGLRETNSVDRLVAAGARGMFTAEEVVNLREAWEVMSRLRIAHQLACLDAGQPPDNFIDPRALSSNERLLLKQAFKALAQLQRAMEDRFRTELLS